MSVSVRRLWAPWRRKYLTRPFPLRGCIFCRAARSRNDRRHLVIARRPKVFALLNLYPYNNGHIMIAPRRHVGDLLSLTADEWAQMRLLAKDLFRRLKRYLKPHGFNVGINLGRAAGAGIPGHLHMHIVPRWHGDTNFMPILTNSKVISQSLKELYGILSESAHGRD